MLLLVPLLSCHNGVQAVTEPCRASHIRKQDQATLDQLLFDAVVDDRNVDTVSALLDEGADVNARPPRGQSTILYYATHMGSAKTVELLVKRGADVNAICIGGCTPLYAACDIRVDKQILQCLLSHGAVASWADAYGYTPLHVSARSNGGRSYMHDTTSYEVMDLLLKYGADVNALDRKGRTPLDEAIEHNGWVEYLQAHGGKSGRELVATRPTTAPM